MKKNLTKKLMLSVLTLAFAVVSLGASTFAWFTLSGTVTVQQFGADVTGGYGLDIAVAPLSSTLAEKDSFTYYTGNLPASAVYDAIENGAEGTWKFGAVTPAGAIADATTFNGIDGQTILKEKKQYVAFKMYFKLTDASAIQSDAQIRLSTLTLTNKSTINNWTADIAYEANTGVNAEVGKGYSYDVLNAARFAVYNGTSTVYEAKAAETFAIGLNTEGFGAYGAFDYYNEKMNLHNQDKVTGVLEAPTEIDGVTYQAGDYSKDDPLVLPTNPNLNTVKMTHAEKKLSQVDDLVIAELTTANASSVFEISVYLWIEGWDAECLNAIFNQSIYVNMEFTLTKTDGTPLV